jgi:hypothetical protein
LKAIVIRLISISASFRLVYVGENFWLLLADIQPSLTLPMTASVIWHKLHDTELSAVAEHEKRLSAEVVNSLCYGQSHKQIGGSCMLGYG